MRMRGIAPVRGGLGLRQAGERVDDEEHHVKEHEDEDVAVEHSHELPEKVAEDRDGEGKPSGAARNEEQEHR